VSATHEEAAREAVRRLGAPDLGVVLGSGFDALGDALGCEQGLEIAPRGSTTGHRGLLARAGRPAGTVWVFRGRVHLHEGFDVAQVVFPVELLAAAGARGVLLTSAAGGLADGLEPGDPVLVRDHLNLTGTDPLRGMAVGERPRQFPDLQRVYDQDWAGRIRVAAGAAGLPLREGVLAAVHGPCYETPAEVRMLRALGAELVGMSVVPEAIAAVCRGLRVAALCCVANRGAGLDPGRPIEHGSVLDRVGRAVETHGAFLVAAVDAGLQVV